MCRVSSEKDQAEGDPHRNRRKLQYIARLHASKWLYQWQRGRELTVIATQLFWGAGSFAWTKRARTPKQLGRYVCQRLSPSCCWYGPHRNVMSSEYAASSCAVRIAVRLLRAAQYAISRKLRSHVVGVKVLGGRVFRFGTLDTIAPRI